MKYAVVSTGGRQYKVAVGDIIDVDLVDAQPESEYLFPQVLLHVDGNNRMIGLPALEKVTVKGIVLSHGKGEKIRVAKFRAKSRYRRVTGFRSSLTKIKILEINP